MKDYNLKKDTQFFVEYNVFEKYIFCKILNVSTGFWSHECILFPQK